MTGALQRSDDALLVRRDQPSKDGIGARGLGQVLFAHRFDLGAEQHVLHREPDFPADEGGHDFVVAREDLHFHTETGQLLEGGCTRVFGWVEKGEEPEQDQV
jgi:hypothetical protein